MKTKKPESGNPSDDCSRLTAENLKKIEWMLSEKSVPNNVDLAKPGNQDYGDLTQLNHDGIIIRSVGRDNLESFANDYLELLGTSSAIYEKNGDYAFGIFSSGWCRMMDQGSRNLCDTPDNVEALNSGCWLCHESCWTECSKRVIAECAPFDIACNGGIRMYAVPILAHGKVAGAINFAYGDPPTDPKKLRELAKSYNLDFDDLVREANAYYSRPPFIVELAKKRLHTTARLIGSIVETKQTEEALRKSEENLRTTLHSIGDAVISTDIQGRIASMNPVAESLTGWSQKEATGQPLEKVFRIINEQTRKPVKSPVASVLENGHIIGLANHTLLLSNKGQEIPIADSGAPIRNQAGEVTGVVLVFRDQTEERAAKKTLKESEARFRCIYDRMATGIARVSLDSRIQSANDAYCNMLGYTEKELIGKHLKEITDPEVVKDNMEKQQMLAKGRIDHYRMEKTFIHKDGSKIFGLLNASLIRDTKGTPSYFLGSVVDITDRKKTEKDLQQYRERMDHVLKATRTNVNIIDSDYNLLEVDVGWLQIYGDPDGRKCHEYFMGSDKPCAKCGIPRALATKKMVVTEEFLPKENRHIEVHTIPFRDKNNEWFVTEFNIDITERKRAEEEREKIQSKFLQAQKMESVGRLAGGVAHDFNNLIMGIMGYTEMCREGIEEDHAIQKWLIEITQEAQRSANLTRQLLAFARKQTVAPQVLDFNEEVGKMLKMLRRLIGEDITLSWQPGSKLWNVKVDPGQFDQVLANLCVNARDAIEGKAGKVSIETQNTTIDAAYCVENDEISPGDYVMLAVTDDGCGMDSRTLDCIFEPFFTTKGLGEGTGLGLATVYGIVKQNKGFVNVESQPGKGTTFRIYLPRFAVEHKKKKTTRTNTDPVGGSETIMVVEDEKSVRLTTTMFLEQLGYTVISAHDANEALLKAGEHAGTIDLLISDVVMPGMSGRNLAQKLTKDYPEIKVLYISGYTADVIAHRGILETKTDFLGKPFSREALAKKIRKVFKSPKS